MSGMHVVKAPRPSRRAYHVDGVELVNVGGEFCAACETRPGIGRSVSGLVVCARCAGMASVLAEEYAAEVRASRERREGRRAEVQEIIRAGNARLDAAVSPESIERGRRAREQANAKHEIPFRCGHSTAPANVYRDPAGYKVCRECKRVRQARRRRAS